MPPFSELAGRPEHRRERDAHKGDHQSHDPARHVRGDEDYAEKSPRATIPAVATNRMRTDSTLNRRLSRPGSIVRFRPASPRWPPTWVAESSLRAGTGSAMRPAYPALEARNQRQSSLRRVVRGESPHRPYAVH